MMERGPIVTELRRALVTGAARGIGAAIAERLAGDGLEVVTLDLRDGCDIAFDVAHDAFPPLDDIDVCVANAGVTTTIAPAHRMTAEQWQLDIDVNLTGAFRTVQACLGGMRERRFGRIIVISSVAAVAGLPGQVAYAASKAGQLGMVRTLAGENASHGITANAILPGLVATEQVLAMPDAGTRARARVAALGRLVRARARSPRRSRSWQARSAAQISGQTIASRRRGLAVAADAGQRAKVAQRAVRAGELDVTCHGLGRALAGVRGGLRHAHRSARRPARDDRRARAHDPGDGRALQRAAGRLPLRPRRVSGNTHNPSGPVSPSWPRSERARLFAVRTTRSVLPKHLSSRALPDRPVPETASAGAARRSADICPAAASTALPSG